MTTQLPPFTRWHILPLTIATTFTFGGMLPFYSPASAMADFGLPTRFQVQRDVGSVFKIYASRMTWLGLLLYTFYLRGDLRAIDTIFSFTWVAGVADGWVCWNEGLRGKAMFRFLSAVVLSAYGYFEMTSW